MPKNKLHRILRLLLTIETILLAHCGAQAATTETCGKTPTEFHVTMLKKAKSGEKEPALKCLDAVCKETSSEYCTPAVQIAVYLKDFKRAKDFANLGCEGYASACAMVGSFALDEDNKSVADEAFKKVLARCFGRKNLVKGDPKEEKVLNTYEKSDVFDERCSSDFTHDLRRYANIAKEQNKPLALDILRINCELGIKEACEGIESITTVGVLTTSYPATSPDKKESRITGIFQKQNHKWASFGESNTSKISNWTIHLQGAADVRISTMPEHESAIFTIRSAKDKIPMQGTATTEYTTWIEAKAFKPLIATTTPGSRDFEAWQKIPSQKRDMQGAIKKFMDLYPKAIRCNTDTTPIKDSSYTVRNIKVLEQYISKNMGLVVGLTLGPSQCDGPPAPYDQKNWFFISDEQKVQHLGAGLNFITYADYDGDGKTEFIFQVQRYNRDGYILFTDAFKENVENTRSYH